MFLILRKAIKYQYKVNCILGLAGICEIKNFLWKKAQPLRQTGFY